MMKIFDWFKTRKKTNDTKEAQNFVEIKRDGIAVSFIHPGHPLYDALVDDEKNQTHRLAPNDAAYNEKSLMHNFVAIVIHNNLNYLVISSSKHFKEQSIGGLLQFDENIYDVIPFFEDEEEYQTANDYVFNETYEYDHPVESYALTASHNKSTKKLFIERGKKPLTVRMIDNNRALFAEKLPPEQLELIDYVVIPAIDAYNAIQEKRKRKKVS